MRYVRIQSIAEGQRGHQNPGTLQGEESPEKERREKDVEDTVEEPVIRGTTESRATL